MSDLHYNSVSLLLHGEGVNTSTTFTDNSPVPKSPSVVGGSAQISTTTPKMGSASISLSSAGSSYLQYATDASFDMGLLDFTIECWWRPVATTVDYSLYHFGNPTASANADSAFILAHYGSSLSSKLRASVYSGSSVYSIESVSALAAGVWYHIRFCRAAGLLYLFINGVQQGSTVSANVAVNTPASRVLRIGRFSDGTPFFANGNIEELRINKGVARSTEGFSVPTAAFEDEGPAETTGTIAAVMPLPAILMTTGAKFELAMPMPTAQVQTGGSIVAAMPTATVSMRDGMRVSATLPMPVARAVITESDLNSIEAAMPMAQVSMRLGNSVRAAMPMATVQMSGTSTIMIRINATMPAAQASMVVTKTESASVAATMPMAQVAIRGGARVAAAMPMAAVSAVGTSGSLVSITAIMPMAQVQCSISSDGTMSIEAQMPMLQAGPWGRITAVMPMASVQVIARSVVAVTYEAYAVNLKPGNNGKQHEVTHYTNWPFDGVVRHGNTYYAWGPTGLFEIGGATDYNAAVPASPSAIAWSWMTTVTDFGSSQKKAMRQMTIGGRLGTQATATVSVGLAADYSYRYSTSRGERAQNYRVKFGKGLDDRYYSVGLSGTGVGDIDTIDFDVEPLSRKV